MGWGGASMLSNPSFHPVLFCLKVSPLVVPTGLTWSWFFSHFPFCTECSSILLTLSLLLIYFHCIYWVLDSLLFSSCGTYIGTLFIPSFPFLLNWLLTMCPYFQCSHIIGSNLLVIWVAFNIYFWPLHSALH